MIDTDLHTEFPLLDYIRKEADCHYTHELTYQFNLRELRHEFGHIDPALNDGQMLMLVMDYGPSNEEIAEAIIDGLRGMHEHARHWAEKANGVMVK